MDSAKLIFSQAVSMPGVLDKINETASVPDEKKEKFAKDFESIFIQKLLDEMKNTIGNWDDEEDGASEQMNGIFWMQLADDIADKGGFGMWKDVSRFLTDLEQKNEAPQLLDKNL